MSEKIVTGNFTIAPVDGIDPNIAAGDTLPADVYQKALEQHQAVLELNISDPTVPRAFIDQPYCVGPTPNTPEATLSFVSTLIHQYRQSNPAVVHGSAIIPTHDDRDDTTLLTDVYLQAKSSFTQMLLDIKQNKVIDYTSSRLDNLKWEHIAFPRIANDYNRIFAILLFIEYDINNPALIVHSLILRDNNQTDVYSTRYCL